MVYEIYGIVNLINRKIYIGQTKQGYRKRFIQQKISCVCSGKYGRKTAGGYKWEWV